MLKQRIATATVLAAAFLAALFGLAASTFAGAMMLVVVLASWEWSALAGYTGRASRTAYVVAIAAASLLLAWWLRLDAPGLYADRARSFFGWACVWWAIALLWIQGYPSSELLWGRRWACAVMGFVVLVPTWVALAVLAHLPGGGWLVLSVVLLVALADIGAFFCGRAFGRHKLAAQVSPGKTWEGFAGGLCTIVLFVIGFALYRNISPSEWLLWLFLAIATGSASVVGDLLESMIKRYCGVKDSGALLPGHGGVLDRIDSLTAALPVFTLLYLLQHSRGGA